MSDTEERIRLLESAVEQSTDAILICTADASDPTSPTIVYVNPAFTEMSGWAAEEVLGQPTSMLESPVISPEQYRQMQLELASGRTLSGESPVYAKDRSQFMMAWKVQPLRDEHDEVTHFVAIQRDVTEQRRLEDQLRQGQKMEALGRLAGGVAHDFNNLLTAAIGYGQQLLDSLGPDHPQREAAEQIDKATRRAANLTGQLLAFSRRQVLRPRVLDLNAVVSDITPMLRRLIGEDVELTTRLCPEPALVKADPGQLEQVLLNLAINARDAMPDGGRMILESANVEVGAEQAHEPDNEPGDYVRMMVRDSGQGMDDEIQARIFEPFFTTKSQEKGTGLGLATVYGIVKQSGGFIFVESAARQGTSFDVYLPRTVRPPAQRIEPSPSSAVARGRERVLVAEDDDGVRRLVAAVLEQSGYQVLTAASGEQALAIAAEAATPIDLLISDIVMPDIRGPELDRQIVGHHPEMRTLFISGYADDRGGLTADVPFLQKPFSPNDFERKVRETLDRPRRRAGPLVPAPDSGHSSAK